MTESARGSARLVLAGALTGLLSLAGTASAQTVRSPADVPDPRRQGGWIVDMADVLPVETEARIERLIDGLNADLGVEVGVVTVHQTSDTPKDFATALFNHWGIGDRDANNGLLVLLVLDQRRLEMETGYGLESSLPDGWLGRMQKEAMVPHFKQGDFGAGIAAGMKRVASRLRGRPDDARRGTGGPLPLLDGGGGSGGSSELPLWLAGLLGFFGFLGTGRGLHHLRMRRHRVCAICDVKRRLLEEDEDDAHLNKGQIAEEALGSINYEVYFCEGCGSTSVYEDRAWFSGYSSCTSCDYKTMSTDSTTTRSPTRYSTGTARVTDTCGHCHYRNSWTKTLPMLPDPSTSSSSSSSSWSSSSSSSSSSWGGGSSGGGGAGSSW